MSEELEQKLKEMIVEAVNAGRKAERAEERKKRNPNYQSTETRLYKYPMLKLKIKQDKMDIEDLEKEIMCITNAEYRDWETDRKSTRLNSSHSAKSRMPSSA